MGERKEEEEEDDDDDDEREGEGEETNCPRVNDEYEDDDASTKDAP